MNPISWLGIATGGWGKVIEVLIVVVAIAGPTAYLTRAVYVAKLDAVELKYAQQAAADNAKAIAQLQKHDDVANAQIAVMQQVSAQRDAAITTLRKAIANAPKTHGCVDSPAIRTLFDGLRGSHPDDRH